MIQRRTALQAGLASAIVTTAPRLRAQTFPSKPIRIIVGFPPGGAADTFARAIQPSLQDSLKQSVVVENRSGANGNIAADLAAKAPADGHTLVLSSAGIETVNPLILAKAPFDASKDLQPVAKVGNIKLFLLTKQTLPPNTIKEFLDYAKKNVGKLSYGSAGSGSTPHLAGEIFKMNTGIFAAHIPYRGVAPAIQDLLAGQIDYMFDSGIGFEHVRAGKLKMLAIASRTRSALFPDVPTLMESGIRGVETDTQFGLWTASGVSADIVARLNQEVNKALAMPTIKQRIAGLGGEVTPMTTADFKSRIQIENVMFGSVIRSRSIKGD